MRPVKIKQVICVNNEVQKHGASNLLPGDINEKRNWLCEEGTPRGIVILELERRAVITAIKIGNAHSAFIEILVGNLGDPTDKYQTLVPPSQFMNVEDSQKGLNTGQVKFFYQKDFRKSVAHKEWEIIQLVCTQPFNKRVRFGICFIRLTGLGDDLTIAPEGKEEEQTQTVPSVKKSEAKEVKPKSTKALSKPCSSKMGLIFSKNTSAREDETRQSTTEGETRQSTTEGETRQSTTEDETEQSTTEGETGQSTTEDETGQSTTEDETGQSTTEDETGQSTTEDETGQSTTEDDSSMKTSESTELEYNTPDGTEMDENDSTRSSSEGETEEQVQKKFKRTKRLKRRRFEPGYDRQHFSKLMEDVFFCISGLQNPERAEIRNQALQMGAKYFSYWKPECTHLICCFRNTPKYHMVKGIGKIVKKEWIEACYANRKRYPWRRFALDYSDSQVGESEEEVIAADDASDEDENVDREEPGPSSRKKTEKQKPVEDDSSETEVDDYGSPFDTSYLPLPHLPDFLTGRVFCVDPTMQIRAHVEKYVIAFNGTLKPDVDDEVEFYITDGDQVTVQILREIAPKMKAVRPEWIWAMSAKSVWVSPWKYMFPMSNIS